MISRKFPRILLFALTLVAFLLTAATAIAQSFTVSSSPQALTVYPGETNVPVTVSVASSTYTGPVNVTLVGLPSGITVSPASLSLAPGSSGTLMLNMALNADQEAFPANAPTNPNTATSNISVVGAVGSTTANSPIALTVSLSNPSFVPSTVNLPIVQINTSGVAITSTETKIPGTITITSADGSKTFLPSSTNTDNTGSFKIHGNTTADFPKLAYTVDLNTSLDLLSVMGLNCPYVTSKGAEVCDKSKHYVLLANYDDKTLLRDWSASALANAIPFGGSYLDETPVPSPNTGVIPTPSGTSTHMPWASHSLFVEVYLNGVYEGNYQLIESVKVDSHRVNISELAETDTGASGDDITGGYLLEIDARMGEDVNFTTPQGLSIGLVDPDFAPDPNVPEQTAYISNYVDTAETALFSSNFTDPTVGWRAYFDEANAVNFYLVNDIMANVDGGDFFSSDYLYKAIDNPFLYMGPVWDFDISAGNVNYQTIVNPTVPWMQTKAIWYAQWFKDPAFKADVIKQFNALKNNGVFSNWVASISQQAATLEQSQANNFQRWPMLGIKVWPNPEAAGSYDGEVAYLTTYLNLRIAYLDSMFNGKTKSATTLSVPSGNVYLNTPVTLTAKATGATIPTGTATFFLANAVIGSAPLDGTGTATITTTNLPVGADSIGLIYNGDSTYALSAASNKIVNVLAPLSSSVTNLAASASSVSAGASVTFNVSIEGNSGAATPTGTVSFVVNGNTVSTQTLASGTASYSTTTLPTGSDSVQAVYSGDTAYQTSTSSTVGVTVTSGLVATTTTASISSNSFPATTPGIISVHVSCNSACGSVFFREDNTGWASATLDANGNFSSHGSLPNSTPGQHTVTVSYLGNSQYAASTSNTVSFTIVPAGATATTTTASISSNSFPAATPGVISVHVSCNSACGSVFFQEDGSGWASATLDANGNFSTHGAFPNSTPGQHTVTVSYLGNSQYAASTSNTVSFTIVAGATATTTTASISSNSFPASTPGIISVHVSCNSACGSVFFQEDSTGWANATLDANGNFSSHGSFPNSTPGSHTVTVTYLGNSQYATSTSNTVSFTIVAPN